MFKILDKRNGEVTAEQQAVFNKISTNNADGYVDGFLNSLRIAKMSSNVISIDSGLLSIQGFRSVNDTLTTYTVNVTPSEPIPFQLVATYSHYISDENDTLEITTRPVQELRREALFSGQNAVYEVELAEFNMTADGIADFTVTLEKIVYNEQDLSELLDKVTQAEQDSSTALEKVNELETQVIEKQGTAVYVGEEAQSRVNFTSDPQTQIDNFADTYALLPTSVTNTSCASGQWAVSAAAGPGTYLIGTFNVYDSNIHLKISGGIVMYAVDSTTDAEVFISTTNYTVEKAVCFANKLYTTSTRKGLYYTIDSSHNLKIFAPIPEYGKLFVSAEITGGTIVGKGDGSIQSPSGGEYIKTNYYFATDPSALTPSTANGWTQTTATGSLPSAGVYMVSFDIPDVDTAGTGILFFSSRTAFAVIGTSDGVCGVYYNHSMSTKWAITAPTWSNPTSVYYKRIA